MNATDPSLDASDSKKSDLNTKLLWLGFPVIFLIWLAYYYFQSPLEKDTPFDRLNTLFSGLAFWGVVFAILLQKFELEAQRNELELTRGEVRGQREQLEAQVATLKKQRFENTFFSLLNLFSDLVRSIEVGQPFTSSSLKGSACFGLFYTDLQAAYTTIKAETKNEDLLLLCNDAYIRFARSRQVHVGHYFRTLYNIIKFVSNSEVENKQFYINLVRAQLSSSELNLLFYNCLSKYGNEKFKPFVEQFGFLENMNLDNLIHQGHKDLFLVSAFKNHS